MRHKNCKAKDNGRLVNFDLLTPKGHIDCVYEDFNEYLDTVDSFYVEKLWDREICMTVRKELRSGKYHWYASKRFAGKLVKRYIGQIVTIEALEEAARTMPTTIYNEGAAKHRASKK